MCQKVPYQSKAEALREVRMIYAFRKKFTRKAATDRKGLKKLYSYECPRCGKWHLTTSKQ